VQDLFGNDCTEIIENPYKRISGKYALYRRDHNYRISDTDKCCKNCIFCLKMEYHNKNYYKCKLQGVSNSESSDVRLKYICNNHKDNL